MFFIVVYVPFEHPLWAAEQRSRSRGNRRALSEREARVAQPPCLV